MQRLLRGWTLYVTFGLLVLFLYWRQVQLGVPEPVHVPEVPVPVVEPGVWWPEQSLSAPELAQRIFKEPRLGFTVLVLTGFVSGMMLGGAVMALWGLLSGRLRNLWHFPAHRLPRWSFAELGRIVLLTVMMATLLPFVRVAILSLYPHWELDAHLWLTMSMLFLDVFLVLMILTFAHGKRPESSTWNMLGFSPQGFVPAIETGLRGYMAVFPWLFLLLYLIVEIARAFHLQPPIEPLQELLFDEQRPLVLSLTFLLACAIGPLAEEFFFRGVLYTALRHRMSRWLAMALSGGLFALIHTNLIGFLPIMLLGMLLAYLYERTGSLISPLAVHILHNSFLLAMAMVVRTLTP